MKNKKTYTPKLRRDEVKSEKFFIILQREKEFDDNDHFHKRKK